MSSTSLSSSITLKALSWSTPDGRSVLDDLDLSFGPGRTGLVGRNGTGKSTLLRLITGELTPTHGHVTVTGTLALMRQEETTADDRPLAALFGAEEGLARLARAAAGEATEEDLAEADWTLDERIASALARFGIDAVPEMPLASLSGGQRTRASLAALEFAAPDIVLLDEPTNNLDTDGQEAVAAFLGRWKGCALVASHDRTLLDTVDEIVELTGIGATRFGGGWTQYRARKAEMLAAAEHDLHTAERQQTEAKKRAQQTAERKARTDNAGKRLRRSGSQSKMLLDKMKEGSEATGGANARLAEARQKQADEALDTAREKIEIIEPLTISLPPCGLGTGRGVLSVKGLVAGYTADAPVIQGLDLVITGPERVALRGPNGSGKSTLLSAITGALPPLSGEVDLHVRAARLDQSVSFLDRTLSVRDNFLRRNPDASANDAHAALARFRFRASAALQPAGSLSGGERLRAGLACAFGVGAAPELLILDEPTNHLDLDAIMALETALKAYDGALLVVSHDEHFLEAIGADRSVELPHRQI